MDEGEAQYQAYKYHNLHGSHLFSCLCILACTMIFSTIWWNDQYLEGTIFPQVLGPSPSPGPGPGPWLPLGACASPQRWSMKATGKATATWSTYGCRSDHIGLQAGSHRVAGRIT